MVSEMVETTVTSDQKADTNRTTKVHTSSKMISTGDVTTNHTMVEHSNSLPSVPLKSSLRITSRNNPWGEKAAKAARTAHKGYRSYGKLKGFKDRATALASTFNSDLADYDIDNDSMSASESDAGSNSNAPRSRNSSINNVKRGRANTNSKRNYDRRSFRHSTECEADDNVNDSNGDTDRTGNHGPGSSLETSQRTWSPYQHGHTNQKVNNRSGNNEKAENETIEKQTVEVTEQEIEDDEYVSDGNIEEARQRPPQKSARVLASRARSFGRIISWITTIVFPLLFVAAGVMTVVVTNKRSDSYIGLAVQQANNIAASVWPIAFAAIVAQSLRAFASFRAERGLRLMTLEQLINSHSLASALKLPFVLRRLNFITVGLVFLWALSPLAGQATLRMLSVGWAGQTGNGAAIFLDVTQDPYVFRDPSNWKSQVDVLYMYSLIEPTNGSNPIGNKSADPWSNPRIPVLSTFTKTNSAGSYNVNSSSLNQPYYSLLGTPISGIRGDNFIANMTITSAYFTLQCSPFQEVNTSILYAPDSPNTAYFNSSYSAFNLGLIKTTDPSTASLGYIDSIQLVSSHINPENGLSYESTTCKLNRTFTTSRLTGNTSNWAVTSISSTPLPPNTPSLNPNSLASCLQHLASNDPPFNATANTLTQRYLHNGSALAGAVGPSDTGLLPPLSSMDLDTFTQRFALVLNTYWHAGFAPWAQTGSGSPYPGIVTFTPATDVVRTDTTQVFRPCIPWLVLLFFSAGVLLVAGIACAVWDAQTIGPDVFGFANALVRNGKDVKLPEGVGSAAMSGPERARVLGGGGGYVAGC